MSDLWLIGSSRLDRFADHPIQEEVPYYPNPGGQTAKWGLGEPASAGGLKFPVGRCAEAAPPR